MNWREGKSEEWSKEKFVPVSVCPWCPGYPWFPAPLSPAAIYNENDTRKFELSPVIITEASSRHNFILDTDITIQTEIGRHGVRCFVQINSSWDSSESLMLFYIGIENRQRNYLNCLFSGLANLSLKDSKYLISRCIYWPSLSYCKHILTF